MTNLLVLSDSHGNREVMREVLSRQLTLPKREQPHYVVFLGDCVRDLNAFDGVLPDGMSVLAVKGNCDAVGASDFPEILRPAFSNYRTMMTHGHRFSVKAGVEFSVQYAAYYDVDLFLFGHTHRPFYSRLDAGEEAYGVRMKKPLILFNPGSLAEGSFGLVRLSEQGIAVSHGVI